MAQEPLATKGNYLHIYDFRVQKGHEEEFIRSFETFVVPGVRRERFERDLVGRVGEGVEVVEEPDRLEAQLVGLLGDLHRPSPGSPRIRRV